MGHALQMIILALIWKLIDQCVVVNDTQRTRLPFRLCAINPLFRTYRLPSSKWHHPALEHRNGYEVFRLGLILLCQISRLTQAAQLSYVNSEATQNGYAERRRRGRRNS